MQAVVDAEPVNRYDVFEFTGDGREYFRIWIVNILLSVVTLGVYSAWAKVRRLEYFYRHTRVAGATFDYHGRPLAILKGRLVAAALFGAYYAATLVSPMLGFAAFVVLAAVMPWLLNRSLMFRFYNSSYRGLRFHFHGSTGSAYWVMLGLPLLSVLSLFTLVPFAHHRMKRYQHANAAFGRTLFSFDAPVSAFYKAYLTVAVCMIGLLFVLGFFAFLLTLVIGLSAADGRQAEVFIFPTVLIIYVLGAMSLFALMAALVQNVVWRHTTLGPYRFTSTLEPHRLLFIQLTNMLKMLGTLGLYKPFADVRLMRYMVGELTLVGVESMAVFGAAGGHDLTAIGEEAAEIFDIDFAF
jgi:uncharacterized membrane protein YjgN (DUF898 family)